MANTTGPVVTNFTTDYDNNVRRMTTAATTQTFYPGAMIGLNSSGLVNKLDDTAAYSFVGLMEGHSREITSTDDATIRQINVKRPLLFAMAIASATASDEGRKVYASDDQTVAYTVGSFGNYVGKVFAVLDSTTVLITPPWSPIFPGSLSGTFTAAATGTTTLTKFSVNKLVVCAATASKSIVLPACALLSPGDKIEFIHTGSGSYTVTLDGNASETINGAATYAMSTAQYDYVTLVTDGANWFVAEPADAGQSFVGAVTITSTSASALTVGANGATNPVLKIDASTASVATGVSVTGAAAAAGVAIAVISSGTNENLKIDAKGSGTITLGSVSTGAVGVNTSLTITSTSANALAIGANGTTNPVVKIDASTASVATGISVTGAAAASGVAVAVVSSGTNEGITIDGKGSGAVHLGSVSTGGVKIGTTAEAFAVKGIYAATVSVTVPSITDPDMAKVDVDVSAAFTMQPAVGDAVIVAPTAALPTNCRLLGAWVTTTDTVQITYGSEGGNVTGAASNHRIIIIDLT